MPSNGCAETFETLHRRSWSSRSAGTASAGACAIRDGDGCRAQESCRSTGRTSKPRSRSRRMLGVPFVLASAPATEANGHLWERLDRLYRDLAVQHPEIRYADAGAQIAPHGQYAATQQCLPFELNLPQSRTSCSSAGASIGVRGGRRRALLQRSIESGDHRAVLFAVFVGCVALCDRDRLRREARSRFPRHGAQGPGSQAFVIMGPVAARRTLTTVRRSVGSRPGSSSSRSDAGGHGGRTGETHPVRGRSRGCARCPPSSSSTRSASRRWCGSRPCSRVRRRRRKTSSRTRSCASTLDWGRINTPTAYLRKTVVNACRPPGAVRVAGARSHRSSWRHPERCRPTSCSTCSRCCRTASVPRSVLQYYEGLTQAEIAEVLGCRVGTVASLVHRGLARTEEGGRTMNDDDALSEALGRSVELRVRRLIAAPGHGRSPRSGPTPVVPSAEVGWSLRSSSSSSRSGESPDF